ncbi:hypothetical protein BsIDN1_61390 [Bacillus safensis]|uniref:Uncharacterized protein n=1 Tax=Bacillus safensis TaxID=561879 RepID=A0A5S9MHV1_BACIA|nr:hypothetical protein BsIDN1_61390 [Bacillus safensis]
MNELVTIPSINGNNILKWNVFLKKKVVLVMDSTGSPARIDSKCASSFEAGNIGFKLLFGMSNDMASVSFNIFI